MQTLNKLTAVNLIMTQTISKTKECEKDQQREILRGGGETVKHRQANIKYH